ncbi:MAG: hypothetical protein ABIL37_04580 [candidate division WOR-3 bacterium]
MLISLSILVFHITFSYCPLQSHPLSEICPIDTNLNMFGFNITNVGVISAGRIIATSFCIGNDCISSWSQIRSDATSPWSNNSIWIFIRDGYPLNVNISNILFVNATTGNVGIGIDNPQAKLDVAGALRLQPSSEPIGANGVIYYDSSLNKFRCYQNGMWIDCITTITEPSAGFWNLTGSFLYPKDLSWNLGIGTSVPTEKLEVQGRVLVVSSNPFELEPSDGTLDVKGSINATGTIYAPLLYANNINASGSIRANSFLIGNTEVITSGRLFLAADGSASSPAYSFSSDSNTGIYRAGSGILGISISGINRANISSTGLNLAIPLQILGTTVLDTSRNLLNIQSLSIGGATVIDSSRNIFNVNWVNASNINVSNNVYSSRYYIGTTQIIDSSRNLINIGNIAMSGSLSIGGINVIDSSRNIINVNWVNASNLSLASNAYIGGSLFFTPDVRLFRGAANRLDLASGNSLNLVSGNLQIGGINVITSNRLFLAADGSASSPAYSFSNDTNTGIYRAGEDNLRFVTGGYDRLTIDSSGRVGINTNTPTEQLEVQGRVLVASSNPFELEPSDGTLDVKGSINATVVFYVPKHSLQPFVCDSSKEGAIFFNTTNKKFYGCNGTAWIILGS